MCPGCSNRSFKSIKSKNKYFNVREKNWQKGSFVYRTYQNKRITGKKLKEKPLSSHKSVNAVQRKVYLKTANRLRLVTATVCCLFHGHHRLDRVPQKIFWDY